MSRAILPSQPHWDENTGIKCPAIILRRLLGDYPPGLIPYDLPPVVDRAGVAISDVTDKHIIFRIGRPGKINSKKVGGNYVYDHDWEAVLIQRQRLLGSPSGLQLYDLVITNTKHWGEAAQIALEFIESTLE